MTTYVEAYETVRGTLLPDGWAGAGSGERYPGDYRGRALVAVQDLLAYLDRTQDFWALEPEPDLGAVLGRYNSLWDSLAPRVIPEPAKGKVANQSVADVTDTAEFVCPVEFFEPDEPVTQVIAAFDAGEKGVTGAPAPSKDADLSALTTQTEKESGQARAESPAEASPSTEVRTIPAAGPYDPASPGPIGAVPE